jgi:putative ABC transport system ATP-binding protein
VSEEIVKAANVWKTYRRGEEELHALKDISLTIYAGEYLSIIGPSGSGKSTFFNMVGALDQPSKGEVFVKGYKLSTLNSRQIAWVRCHNIGFIFQSFNLIPSMTALENVSIARVFAGSSPEDAKKDATAVLSRIGLGHRLTHLPSQLSGGQQQRVAIARAMVNKPSIILADEPTGNLDLRTGEDIIKLLSEMKQELGITIISATHDMKMLSASDRVVSIADGQIASIKKRSELNIQVGTIGDH